MWVHISGQLRCLYCSFLLSWWNSTIFMCERILQSFLSVTVSVNTYWWKLWSWCHDHSSAEIVWCLFVVFLEMKVFDLIWVLVFTLTCSSFFRLAPLWFEICGMSWWNSKFVSVKPTTKCYVVSPISPVF